jgi:hypothetical protein
MNNNIANKTYSGIWPAYLVCLACANLQGLLTGLSGLSALGLNGEYGYKIKSDYRLVWLVWLMIMCVAILQSLPSGFLWLVCLVANKVCGDKHIILKITSKVW